MKKNKLKLGRMAGIYKIENKVDNKIYIGSSLDLSDRMRQHEYMLNNGTHHNARLQSAVKEYGISAFRFTIMELSPDNITKKELLKLEQKYIDDFEVVKDGYNINPSTTMYKDKTQDAYSYGLIKEKILFLEQVPDETKKMIEKNISIYKGKMNEFGEGEHFSGKMSSSWFTRASKEEVEQLSRNISNYFNNTTRTPSRNRVWTCNKTYQGSLQNFRISRNYVEVDDTIENYRGTKSKTLAFISNYHINPFIIKSFREEMLSEFSTIPKANDSYALGILLNFLINNAIIEEPFNLYMPSLRMRNILSEWLES